MLGAPRPLRDDGHGRHVEAVPQPRQPRRLRVVHADVRGPGHARHRLQARRLLLQLQHRHRRPLHRAAQAGHVQSHVSKGVSDHLDVLPYYCWQRTFAKFHSARRFFKFLIKF